MNECGRVLQVLVARMVLTGGRSLVDLTLSVPAGLAGCLIGRGGATLRGLKEATGVSKIQLGQQPANGWRSVNLGGSQTSVAEAYTEVARLLRAESRLAPDAPWSVRVILKPGAAGALIGNGGKEIRALRYETGASVEVDHLQASASERTVTCAGGPAETQRAVHAILAIIAKRQHERHHHFLAQWAFETDYLDHFETPPDAFADVMPLLRCRALDVAATPRRGSGSNNGADDDDNAAATALRELCVYDPYYCQGAVRRALVALGCAPGRVLNENADFYAAVEARRVPAHDLLLTNPPYSGDHKVKRHADCTLIACHLHVICMPIACRLHADCMLIGIELALNGRSMGAGCLSSGEAASLPRNVLAARAVSAAAASVGRGYRLLARLPTNARDSATAVGPRAALARAARGRLLRMSETAVRLRPSRGHRPRRCTVPQHLVLWRLAYEQGA